MAQAGEGNEPPLRTSKPAMNRRWQNSPNWRAKTAAPKAHQENSESNARPAQPNFNRDAGHPRFNNRNNRTQGSSSTRTSSKPLEQRNDGPLAAPDIPTSFLEGRRLYVGNMPYMAKREDVEVLFSNATKHGQGYYQIERIDISIDPFTGRNPSFCFVELASKEQATNAMEELDGIDMLGRPVKIKPGVPKTPKPLFGRRGSSGQDEKPPQPFIFDRWGRDDAATHWYGVAEEGRRLFVGGLPRMPNQAAADYEIQKLFYGFKMCAMPPSSLPKANPLLTLPLIISEAISKVVSPHHSKRAQPGSHYFLFVDLESAEEADRAIKVLGGVSAVWGCPVHINKARGNSQKPTERDRWGEGNSNDKPEERQSENNGNSSKSSAWRGSRPRTTTESSINPEQNPLIDIDVLP
ncbi:hypothetical protein LOZ12_003074 [Ophidiomyces ophidiicola]|uniref:Uncharacterized protein n=1 Tax=Ophidiomyces ophidiicola TaxID=1387563 RepID=A0ACB8UZC6_9EURO|nr:uncharacterized protein LOZ57_001299 [Ophidiomyces ophidiicola]KAI1911384.1 hypothetical protein LOZ61_003907 [Ophidiomyces ophidiicola]KAI1926827.1 hypothetical protein LOZ60_003316 [Ophidiomyces ophidiicola]KAI1947368.1 hypothetical protein LOZ62_003056 [Ophidiomyces ophidiicola]KAI1951886.1 hypothetical protein LOZ57_001299 [Ophidiomyces ophidiicola]KAI1958744.1 hypothetical protein LOZ59_003306 [Ophidiomyces ophidiicola]